MKKSKENVEQCLAGLMIPVKNLLETTTTKFPWFAIDNIANDIAEEWDSGYFEYYCQRLKELGYDPSDILLVANDICTAFEEISFGMPKFNPDLWTPQGFEDSLEWQMQREKATRLKSLIERLKPASSHETQQIDG